MFRFIARRLLTVIPLLLVATLIIFVLIDLAPGDSAQMIAGEEATLEQVEQVRERLGLNDPLPVRYASYLADVARGDLGTSLYSSRTVWDAMISRFPTTLALTSVALVFATLIAVPLGTLAAIRRDGVLDRLVTGGASLFMALPPFVFGIVLLVMFAVNRQWFPATGYSGPSEGITEWLRYVTLPAIALAGVPAAELTRMIRGALIDALDEDYVRTARAKGMGELAVVGKHAAKNAAIPIVTVFGLNVSALIGGSIVVERVFAIPGFGSLVIDSVIRQDVPVIQGIVLITALVAIMANLTVDVSYGYFNPKLRDA